MKKWTGGTLILILTLLLSLRYSLYPSLPLPTKKKALTPNPPLLPSIKLHGLTELFSTKLTHNFTQLNPNPSLVWAHMLPLLSRPDALPATADGVREASIAWRELLADIKAEKDASFGVLERKKKCPFSVGGNESVVGIPCGLIQNSAVTVVGVPVGRNGSNRFGFELVGEDNGGGGELPVVIRVNVSIGGDEVVVGQSSWRPESGWEEWELCPGRGAAANISNLKDLLLLWIPI